METNFINLTLDELQAVKAVKIEDGFNIKKDNQAIVELEYIKGRVYQASNSPVDFQSLETELTSDFDNFGLMDSVSFLIQPSSVNRNILNLEFLTQSTSALVYTASFPGTSQILNLKNFDHSSDLSKIIHEIFVSLFGTNQLRKLIPNFCFTYGAFESKLHRGDRPWDPIASEFWNFTSSEDEEDQNYSRDNKIEQSSVYLITENIQDSLDLSSMLPTASLKEFVNWYLQILLSINMAYKIIGFTHHDLHGHNILIRKIDNPRYIQYIHKEQPLNLWVKSIATIIDFELSYFDYQQQGFSVFDMNLRTKSFPVYDAYTLTWSCMEHLINREDSFDLAKRIYRYFSLEEVDDKSSQYNAIPYNERTRGNLDNLIDHTMEVCKDYLSEEQN